MPAETELREILNKYRIEGEEIKVVVSRDGLHLSSIGLGEEVVDTFAAMCATMYGAGDTALFEIDRKPTEYLALVSQDATLYILAIGENMLLAVLVGPKTPLVNAISTMQKMADEISQLEP